MNILQQHLIDVLDNYENWRVDDSKIPTLNELKSRIRNDFHAFLKEVTINNIKVKTNNGQGKLPKLENFNIAFLEPNHTIKKGIYCGIDFNVQLSLVKVYVSTSYTEMPDQTLWRKIFEKVFDDLKLNYHWANWKVPANDEWRYTAICFNIKEIDDESFLELLWAIQVGIWQVRLIIEQNRSYVEEYLNIPPAKKKNDCHYRIDQIKQRLSRLAENRDQKSIQDGEIQTPLEKNTPTAQKEIILDKEDLDIPNVLNQDEEYRIVEFEGKRYRITHSTYERNPKLRKACFQYYSTDDGISCFVCGFNFKRLYGELGIDFIEIHHKIPLGSVKEVMLVNATKDLVPLCSNCHSMIHRKKTALTVDELIKIVQSIVLKIPLP